MRPVLVRILMACTSVLCRSGFSRDPLATSTSPSYPTTASRLKPLLRP
jgi:hypothetical protein